MVITLVVYRCCKQGDFTSEPKGKQSLQSKLMSDVRIFHQLPATVTHRLFHTTVRLWPNLQNRRYLIRRMRRIPLSV